MRIRHRVPSIFNLSMVDVLCCALGCVILLWLLNLREAKQKADQAGQSEQQLAEMRDVLAVTARDRDDLRSRLDEATAHLDDLTRQAGKLHGELADSARQLADTQKRLLATEEQVRTATAAADQTRQERDAARTDLASRGKELADLTKTLTALKVEKKDVEDRLARQARDYTDLEKKLSGSVQRVLTMESQVREKDSLAEANGRRADSLMSKLGDAEGRLRKLQALADLVPGLQEDVKRYRDKFAVEEALANGLEKEIGERVRELAMAAKELKELRAAKQALEQNAAARDKDLAALKDADRAKLAAAEERLAELAKEVAARSKDVTEASARIEDLQNDRKALRGEADRLRSAADNRFAGITLTGRRVVFLVDMSGSMKLVDESTPAPDKWVAVRETLAKVLRSLPQVEKFQVVAFSDRVIYPLGQDGHWLDYDAGSADRALEALAKIDPKGGTDMYSGLRAALGFRDKGLDTVYLLSDGLPNLGEGLTAEQAKTLTEQQQGEILGRYMRQTLKTDWNRTTAGRPRVRINTIGFFFESPDVGAFLWALARENDGSFVGMSRP